MLFFYCIISNKSSSYSSKSSTKLLYKSIIYLYSCKSFFANLCFTLSLNYTESFISKSESSKLSIFSHSYSNSIFFLFYFLFMKALLFLGRIGDFLSSYFND